MNEVLEQFPMQFRELRERSGRLSVELRSLGRGLSENGRVPSPTLLAELRRFGDDFRRVRGQLTTLNTGRLASSADESPSASLAELEQEWEQRIAIRRALRLLDRLDAVRLHDERDAPHWDRCLNDSREQRRELSSLPLPQAAMTATRLASGEHSLEAVLMLIADHAALSDERWRMLYEKIGERYGPELATAIVRQRLTVRHETPYGSGH